MKNFDIRTLQAKALKARKKSIAEQAKRVSGVPFAKEVNGVKVIAKSVWLEFACSDWKFKHADKVERQLFAWCQKNKAHYYRASVEFYSEENGVTEAVNLNRKVVVTEMI